MKRHFGNWSLRNWIAGAVVAATVAVGVAGPVHLVPDQDETLAAPNFHDGRGGIGGGVQPLGGSWS